MCAATPMLETALTASSLGPTVNASQIEHWKPDRFANCALVEVLKSSLAGIGAGPLVNRVDPSLISWSLDEPVVASTRALMPRNVTWLGSEGQM